jgi:hypothetical protein
LELLPQAHPGGELVPQAHPGGELVPQARPGGELLPQAHPGGELLPQAHPGGELLPQAHPGGELLPQARPGGEFQSDGTFPEYFNESQILTLFHVFSFNSAMTYVFITAVDQLSRFPAGELPSSILHREMFL